MSDPSQPSDHDRDRSDAEIGADDRIASDERAARADRVGPEGDPRDESTQVADEERRRNTALVSVIVAAVGVWVIISPVIYDVGTATLWNNVIVGGVVLLGGAYNYYRLSNDIPLSVGVASLVTLLGIWLIVSTALLEMVQGAFWSTVVSGLIIVGLSGYNAYEAREARTVAEPETGVR